MVLRNPQAAAADRLLAAQFAGDLVVLDGFLSHTLLAIVSIVVAAPASAQTKLKWAHVYETSEPYHKWSVWAAQEIEKRTNEYSTNAEPVPRNITAYLELRCDRA